MSKKNIISITGGIATGKTEVTRILSSKLGMQIYSGSEGFRKLAKKNNMDLVTFNEYIKDKPGIDKSIDDAICEFIKNNDKIIVDARLAWYFEKESFKIYIESDITVAAKRLLEDKKNRTSEGKYMSIEEAKDAILSRQKYEIERYKREYGVDLLDFSNYDLVIDSSNIPLEEVAVRIVKKYLQWLER